MGLFFVWSFSAAIFLLSIQRGQCAHIVGGKVSDPHSRPYMAALSYGTTNFFCGGTLINENWVLTAAHCSYGLMYEGLYVVLGAHEQKKEDETGRQHIKIAKMFIYPDYIRKPPEHDIMLLKLAKKAKIDKYVKPVQLSSTSDDVQPGTRCLVTGWGRIYYGWEPSDTLREADVTVMDRMICNDENHWAGQIVKDTMLCAGDPRAEKGPCNGDSGGPLICNGEQKGITSFTKKYTCGDPKYPAVYTRLTEEHLSWITYIMNVNY